MYVFIIILLLLLLLYYHIVLKKIYIIQRVQDKEDKGDLRKR